MKIVFFCFSSGVCFPLLAFLLPLLLLLSSCEVLAKDYTTCPGTVTSEEVDTLSGAALSGCTMVLNECRGNIKFDGAVSNLQLEIKGFSCAAADNTCIHFAGTVTGGSIFISGAKRSAVVSANGAGQSFHLVHFGAEVASLSRLDIVDGELGVTEIDGGTKLVVLDVVRFQNGCKGDGSSGARVKISGLKLSGTTAAAASVKTNENSIHVAVVTFLGELSGFETAIFAGNEIALGSVEVALKDTPNTAASLEATVIDFHGVAALTKEMTVRDCKVSGGTFSNAGGSTVNVRVVSLLKTLTVSRLLVTGAEITGLTAKAENDQVLVTVLIFSDAVTGHRSFIYQAAVLAVVNAEAKKKTQLVSVTVVHIFTYKGFKSSVNALTRFEVSDIMMEVNTYSAPSVGRLGVLFADSGANIEAFHIILLSQITVKLTGKITCQTSAVFNLIANFAGFIKGSELSGAALSVENIVVTTKGTAELRTETEDMILMLLYFASAVSGVDQFSIQNVSFGESEAQLFVANAATSIRGGGVVTFLSDVTAKRILFLRLHVYVDFQNRAAGYIEIYLVRFADGSKIVSPGSEELRVEDSVNAAMTLDSQSFTRSAVLFIADDLNNVDLGIDGNLAVSNCTLRSSKHILRGTHNVDFGPRLVVLTSALKSGSLNITNNRLEISSFTATTSTGFSMCMFYLRSVSTGITIRRLTINGNFFTGTFTQTTANSVIDVYPIALVDAPLGNIDEITIVGNVIRKVTISSPGRSYVMAVFFSRGKFQSRLADSGRFVLADTRISELQITAEKEASCHVVKFGEIGPFRTLEATGNSFSSIIVRSPVFSEFQFFFFIKPASVGGIIFTGNSVVDIVVAGKAGEGSPPSSGAQAVLVQILSDASLVALTVAGGGISLENNVLAVRELNSGAWARIGGFDSYASSGLFGEAGTKFSIKNLAVRCAKMSYRTTTSDFFGIALASFITQVKVTTMSVTESLVEVEESGSDTVTVAAALVLFKRHIIASQSTTISNNEIKGDTLTSGATTPASGGFFAVDVAMVRFASVTAISGQSTIEINENKMHFLNLTATAAVSGGAVSVVGVGLSGSLSCSSFAARGNFFFNSEAEARNGGTVIMYGVKASGSLSSSAAAAGAKIFDFSDTHIHGSYTSLATGSYVCSGIFALTSSSTIAADVQVKSADSFINIDSRSADKSPGVNHGSGSIDATCGDTLVSSTSTTTTTPGPTTISTTTTTTTGESAETTTTPSSSAATATSEQSTKTGGPPPRPTSTGIPLSSTSTTTSSSSSSSTISSSSSSSSTSTTPETKIIISRTTTMNPLEQPAMPPTVPAEWLKPKPALVEGETEAKQAVAAVAIAVGAAFGAASVATQMQAGRRLLQAGGVVSCGRPSVSPRDNDFSMNPFYLRIEGGGDVVLASYRGALVSIFLFFVLTALLSALAVFVRFKWNQRRNKNGNSNSNRSYRQEEIRPALKEAAAEVHVPAAFALTIAVFANVGANTAAKMIAYASMLRVETADEAKTSSDTEFAVAGLLLFAVAPVAATAMVAHLIQTHENLDEAAQLSTPAAQQQQQQQQQRQQLDRGCIAGGWHWLTEPRGGGWKQTQRVRHLNYFFDSYSVPRYATIDVTSAMAIGIIAGVADCCSTRKCCIGAGLSITVVAALQCGVIVFLSRLDSKRPLFLLRIEWFVFSALALTTMVSAAVGLAAVAMSKEDQSVPDSAIVSAVSGIAFAAGIVIMIGVSVNILLNVAIPLFTTLRESAATTEADSSSGGRGSITNLQEVLVRGQRENSSAIELLSTRPRTSRRRNSNRRNVHQQSENNESSHQELQRVESPPRRPASAPRSGNRGSSPRAAAASHSQRLPPPPPPVLPSRRALSRRALAENI